MNFTKKWNKIFLSLPTQSRKFSETMQSFRKGCQENVFLHFSLIKRNIISSMIYVLQDFFVLKERKDSLSIQYYIKQKAHSRMSRDIYVSLYFFRSIWLNKAVQISGFCSFLWKISKDAMFLLVSLCNKIINSGTASVLLIGSLGKLLLLNRNFWWFFFDFFQIDAGFVWNVNLIWYIGC